MVLEMLDLNDDILRSAFRDPSDPPLGPAFLYEATLKRRKPDLPCSHVNCYFSCIIKSSFALLITVKT
jgi:hypothetical protein